MKTSIAILAVVIACALPASADPITWGAVTNETGNASDVITNGTFFTSALTNSSSTTVNGVTFYGQSSYTSGTETETFASGSHVTMTGVSCYQCPYGSPPASWPAAYQTLVRGESFGSDNSDILVGNLTPGDSYEVQIFESYWNINWYTSFNDGTNSSGPLNVGVVGSDIGQYVTGTFTASGTTEDIHVNSTTGADILDAIQVRDLNGADTGGTVPEPATLGLVAAGLLGIARRRK